MKALKEIAYLKDKVQWLDVELRKIESLLSGFISVATEQSRRLASISAAEQDTLLWDPSTSPRRSTSTPQPWTEVVIRNRCSTGRPAQSSMASPPPALELSNRFSVLSEELPKNLAQPASLLLDDTPDPVSVHPAVADNPATPDPLGDSLDPADSHLQPEREEVNTPGLHLQPAEEEENAPLDLTTSPVDNPATPDPLGLAPADSHLQPGEVNAPDPHLQPTEEEAPLDLAISDRVTQPRQPASRPIRTASPSSGSTDDPAPQLKPETRATSRIDSASSQPRRQSRSSPRRRLLRQAVVRRSGHLQPPTSTTSGGEAPSRPTEASSPASTSSASSAAPLHAPATSAAASSMPASAAGLLQAGDRRVRSSAPAAPKQLPPPTALIIGDSIIKKLRFSGAITHCLPGATVPVILHTLKSLLPTLPMSISTLVVHVGTNDIMQTHTEPIKSAFLDLFNFLKQTGKVVYVSGPIPTFQKGDMRFSKLFGLHTWLSTASRAQDLGFIDNFDLFWERGSFYYRDGIHPSTVGSKMLTENMLSTMRRASLNKD